MRACKHLIRKEATRERIRLTSEGRRDLSDIWGAGGILSESYW